MRPLRLTVFSLLAFSSLLAAQASAAPGTKEPSRNKALLVGIADYPAHTSDSDVRDLPVDLAGPVNDIHNVRLILMRKYGFESSDIVLLQDDSATHENVLKALKELGDQCGPESCALFWYSGHGSLIPDKTKRESYKTLEDGTAGFFDGSLVCYDSRNDPKHNRDLSDDELYSLVRRVAKKAKQTVIVTDSCFSGGVTRGGAHAGVRFQPAGTLPWDAKWVKSVFPKDVVYLDDDSKQRDIDRKEGMRYVHIAACSDVELAAEDPEKGMGVLTVALCSALNTSEAPGSWREVAQAARAKVRGAKFTQTVWFEGALDEPVFGGSYKAGPKGFSAQWQSRPQVLVVDAGRVHGIGANSEFDVFDWSGAKVGRAKAERIEAGSSHCVFVGAAPKKLEREALVCRPTGAGGTRAPLRVRLGDRVPSDLLAGSAYAIAAKDGADGTIENLDGKLVLLDRDGYQVRAIPQERDLLEAALFHEHAFVSLRELGAVNGIRKLALKVLSMPDDVAKSYKRTRATFAIGRDGRATVRANELCGKEGGSGLMIEVSNLGSDPSHITVLSVCDDRSVTVVYPPEGQPDNVLAPGKKVLIPVLVGPSAAWTHDRPMVDRYIAVATPKFADFSSCKSDSTIEQVTAATRGGDDESGMPPALAFSMFGGATRGESLAKRARDAKAATDFGVATIDLLLPKVK
jgi:hypothetical protein